MAFKDHPAHQRGSGIRHGTRGGGGSSKQERWERKREPPSSCCPTHPLGDVSAAESTSVLSYWEVSINSDMEVHTGQLHPDIPALLFLVLKVGRESMLLYEFSVTVPHLCHCHCQVHHIFG